MAGVVIDTSVWIRFFSGSPMNDVTEALEHGAVVVPPIVVSELITGATTQPQRLAIGELLQDAPIHSTPLDHWIRVGDLRRTLARKGLWSLDAIQSSESGQDEGLPGERRNGERDSRFVAELEPKVGEEV